MNRRKLNSYRKGFEDGFKGEFAISSTNQRLYNNGYKKGMELRFKKLRSN